MPIFPFSSETIAQAAIRLRAGDLVAFPTETVYGVGANAENPAAVTKIYQVKGRPSTHPVIVHLAKNGNVHHWAKEWPTAAEKLTAIFWPGPLTLIVKRKPEISDVVTGGQDTIALRCPAHPVAQALLTAFGGGIAAPSANRFGRISPTTAEHVQTELGKDVDFILDGGACQIGIESTIIDLSRGYPVLLRPGQITRRQLEEALGQPIQIIEAKKVTDLLSHPRAPGMLESHYAPQTPLRLFTAGELQQYLTAAQSIPNPLAVYSYSLPEQKLNRGVWKKASNTVTIYAQKLYADLRELDQMKCKEIWVEKVPESMEWQGVADRLQRACHQG